MYIKLYTEIFILNSKEDKTTNLEKYIFYSSKSTSKY